MTKSEIFKAAHRNARNYIALKKFSNYRAAFASALSNVYKSEKGFGDWTEEELRENFKSVLSMIPLSFDLVYSQLSNYDKQEPTTEAAIAIYNEFV